SSIVLATPVSRPGDPCNGGGAQRKAPCSAGAAGGGPRSPPRAPKWAAVIERAGERGLGTGAPPRRAAPARSSRLKSRGVMVAVKGVVSTMSPPLTMSVGAQILCKANRVAPQLVRFVVSIIRAREPHGNYGPPISLFEIVPEGKRAAGRLISRSNFVER